MAAGQRQMGMQQIKSDFEPLYQIEKFHCEKVLISYLENVQAKEEADLQYIKNTMTYVKIRQEVVDMMGSEINDFISILCEFNTADGKNVKKRLESNCAVSKSTNNLYNIMITKISGKLLYERKKVQELEKKYNEMVANESHITDIIEQSAAIIDSITVK